MHKQIQFYIYPLPIINTADTVLLVMISMGGTNAEPLVSCQPVAPSRARLGLVYTALVVFRAIFGIEASKLRYISTNSDRICFKYLTTQAY